MHQCLFLFLNVWGNIQETISWHQRVESLLQDLIEMHLVLRLRPVQEAEQKPSVGNRQVCWLMQALFLVERSHKIYRPSLTRRHPNENDIHVTFCSV